jgi:hypothetical protein
MTTDDATHPSLGTSATRRRSIVLTIGAGEQAPKAWPLPLAVAAEVCLSVLAAGAIAWLGRDRLFFQDEWGLIFYRRSGGASAYFAAFHGHLFAGVVAIYNILFATVGLRHYGAYLGVEIALNLVCASLLFCYAYRRGLGGPLAVVASSFLVLLGPAFAVLFWLASAGFVIAIICFLATLLIWDSGLRGANVMSAVLACVALGSHGTGVPIVLGLLVASLGHGRSARRLLALGLPLVGWAAWFTTVRRTLLTPASLRLIAGAAPNGDVGTFGSHLTSQLLPLPAWLFNSAAGALSALVGRPGWTPVGVLIGMALAAGLVLTFRNGTLDRWRAVGACVAVVGFWLFTGVSRQQVSSPSASRYLYPGVALLLVVFVECARTVRLRSSVIAVVAMIAAISLGVHVGVLRTESQSTARSFARERTALSLLESCRGRVSPGLVTVQGVPAGPFWAATKALGDPVTPAPPRHDALCPDPHLATAVSDDGYSPPRQSSGEWQPTDSRGHDSIVGDAKAYPAISQKAM